MKPNLALADSKVNVAAESLARVLCNQVVLMTMARNFHWNIAGPAFFSLHAAFQAEYESLAAVADDTAEKIRAFGAQAPGRMSTFLKYAEIQEKDPCSEAKDCVRALLDGHETAVKCLREELKRVEGVCEVENYYQDLIAAHEKSAWMLRSFLVS